MYHLDTLPQLILKSLNMQHVLGVQIVGSDEKETLQAFVPISYGQLCAPYLTRPIVRRVRWVTEFVQEF